MPPVYFFCSLSCRSRASNGSSVNPTGSCEELAGLKATFFAVMASFTNLALSASQLGTKYLNQLFVVTREVKEAATGAVKVPADYGQLGDLMLTAMVIGFLVPIAAVVVIRLVRLRSA